jgi:hypothetical protein
MGEITATEIIETKIAEVYSEELNKIAEKFKKEIIDAVKERMAEIFNKQAGGG